MNDRVKNFLEKRKAEERKDRTKILIAAGLYDKIYADDAQTDENESFPSREWDANKNKWRFYRKEPISVTDEELQEISKYVQESEEESKNEMFSNISGKLKVCAMVLFWIGIGISVIMAIINFTNASEAYRDLENIYMLRGFIFLIAGVPLSCLFSWAMYAFGELVEKVSKIERKLK